jgi:hypothetical protein
VTLNDYRELWLVAGGWLQACSLMIWFSNVVQKNENLTKASNVKACSIKHFGIKMVMQTLVGRHCKQFSEHGWSKSSGFVSCPSTVLKFEFVFYFFILN